MGYEWDIDGKLKWDIRWRMVAHICFSLGLSCKPKELSSPVKLVSVTIFW